MWKKWKKEWKKEKAAAYGFRGSPRRERRTEEGSAVAFPSRSRWPPAWTESDILVLCRPQRNPNGPVEHPAGYLPNIFIDGISFNFLLRKRFVVGRSVRLGRVW